MQADANESNSVSRGSNLSSTSDAISRPENALTIGTITRRAAVGGMAAAALGFAVFGPRGSKEVTGGRVVLDYWEKWTGIEGKAMQRVVNDFNNSQSRIFVRYFAMSGIDQKTQVAIAGKAPPDVVGLWNYNVPSFAAAGAIEPLDELGAEFGVGLEKYAAGIRQVLTYPDAAGKERMWATVNTGGTLAMYYNKAHFREAGLDPEKPPLTIAELDAYALKCTVKSKTQAGDYARVGFHHREPGWWNFIWGYHFGGSLYDDKTKQATLDSPENIAAYEWMQSYGKAYGIDALNTMRSSFGNYDSAQNAFINGSVSMILQGPWLANMINSHKPDLDYGVAPFPVAERLYEKDAPIGLIDTDVLVIPKGVRNPKASMEFVAYTQRPDVVEFLSTVHCKGSPLASSSEAFRKNHPNRGIEVFEAIGRSPRSFRVPPTPTWLALRDQMEFMIDDVWNNRRSAAQALNGAQRRGQAIVDRDSDQRRRRAGSSAGGVV